MTSFTNSGNPERTAMTYLIEAFERNYLIKLLSALLVNNFFERDEALVLMNRSSRQQQEETAFGFTK